MKISGIEMDIFGDSDPRKMPLYFFSGASLKYSTAQRADVSKQNVTVAPRHWYIDATIKCCDCRKKFVFTAAEQRFWYEDRKFYVDSFPKRCADCRKRQGIRLELKKRYDAMIASALGRCPAEEKKEAIRIID